MMTLILIYQLTDSVLQEGLLNRNITAAKDVRASFTPLICSDERVIHEVYASIQKRVNENVARGKSKPFSQVIECTQVQCQSIVVAVTLRSRGLRIENRSTHSCRFRKFTQ